VPLANAAAKEAREAAASCDAALTDSAGEADMSNMRGWLMMVATLFVGIAFQSILQRPPVISSQDCSLKAVSNAASPAPAPSPAATADSADSLGAWSHLNVLTMFISLGDAKIQLYIFVGVTGLSGPSTSSVLHQDW
jgi:hypothetical protein